MAGRVRVFGRATRRPRVRRRGRFGALAIGVSLSILLLAGCTASKADGARQASHAPAAQQATVSEGSTSAASQPTTVQGIAAPASPAATPASAARTVQGTASGLPVVSFSSTSGAGPRISVEIADDEASQECGLMNRTSMPDDQGMVFLFSRENLTPFWMKDTLIPLSIAFINARGDVVDIQEMQALSEDNHYPAMPYKYAIEANAGWYARHGVHVGDTADLSQAIAASPVYGGAPPLPSPCHESTAP